MAGQRISVLQRARMQREMRKESRTGKMRNSMKQTEQRMKTRWILAFLAMLVCFCGWWAVRKEGFFADELYSYGLSNSNYAPFLSWYYNGERAYSGTSAEHIYSREDFMSYVAVQEGQRFDYARFIIIRRRMSTRRYSTFYCTRFARCSRAALQNGLALA